MLRPSLLFVLLCLTAPSLTLAQSDQVFSYSNDITRGAVKKITKNDVEVEERGTPRKIPTSQIKKIHFSGEPNDLKSGRDAAIGEKFDEALESLGKIKADDLNRDEAKVDLAFYIAYSKGKLALAGSDRAAAEKELLDFVRANGDSFHFYKAAELLGDISFASGAYDDAAKRYAAISKSESPELQMKGGYLEAKSLLGKGDVPAALAKFEQIIAMPQNDSAAAGVKALCEIGKARCLIETGKHAEGIALAQSVVDKSDPKDSELLGAGYLAIAVGKLHAENKKSAIIAFLQVTLLFPANRQAHAEALFNLEKLWTEQGKPDRAQECRNLLREQYGGTVWAAKG